MRKIFPRIVNVITFLVALVAFIPDTLLLRLVNYLANFLPFLAGFANLLASFFTWPVWYSIRIIYLPAFFAVISIIYLIVATVDRNIKKNNKKTTPALDLMSYYPLIFFGVISSLLGLINSVFDALTAKSNFVILDNDYFFLGYFVKAFTNYPFEFYWYVNIIFYAAIFVALTLLYLFAFKKNYRRPFILRFLCFLLVAILAFLSLKGYNIYNRMDSGVGFIKLLTFQYTDNIVSNLSQGLVQVAELDKIQLLVFIFGAIYLFVVYAIVGIVRIIKNNKLIKQDKLQAKEKEEDEELFKPVNSVPTFEDLTKGINEIDTNISNLETKEETIPESIYEEPQVEEIVETVVEEKTVIKQVVFDKSNLDSIYAYNFNFNNVQMVVNNDGSQDYYVNKIKFLTLSSNYKFMSFRLELDRAIKLIIQYPLILKDRYEDHKIWFKVDNADLISSDIVIMIIKDAYNAVINDN